MKAAVVLQNAPDLELDRWEFDHTGDEDEVDRKVSDILDGMTFRIGDTIKIVDVA